MISTKFSWRFLKVGSQAGLSIADIDVNIGLHIAFESPMEAFELVRLVRLLRGARLRAVTLQLSFVEHACSAEVEREVSAWAEDEQIEEFSVSGVRFSLGVASTPARTIGVSGCSVRVQHAPFATQIHFRDMWGRASHWDEVIGSAPLLEHVELAGLGSLRSLRGFPPLVSWLELAYMRGLTSLDAVAPEPLRMLILKRCPAIDLDTFGAQSRMSELRVGLTDVKRPGIGRLAAKGVAYLDLIDSDVIDDDLDPLVGVPDLQMNWKKHYPLTQDELDARRGALGLPSSRWRVG